MNSRKVYGSYTSKGILVVRVYNPSFSSKRIYGSYTLSGILVVRVHNPQF